MWKYVSRRIRDTFERSVNHFDKRSSAGVVNSAGSVSDEKSKRSSQPCRWFCAQKCWSSFRDEGNDTNNKRWNFEDLNRSWIGAITWSSALVLGWYANQLIHLKLKYGRNNQKVCPKNSLLSALQPYVTSVNNKTVYLNTISQIERVIDGFVPKVISISNEHNAKNSDSSGVKSASSTDSTDSDLGDVLNSIENKLGLAAIENGHHQDGLNLLRSAANRNHAPALYNLGLCYELGLGVETNEKVAMEMYRSAAVLEHPAALFNLGVYYGQGRGGLARDTAMATRLLRLAAVQGQSDAIKALQALEVDTLPSKPPNDEFSWLYHCVPFDNSVVPTPTSLFVENVDYLSTPNHMMY